MRIITSEHLYRVKTPVIRRVFRKPRKGKNKGPKFYRLKPIRVPSNDIVMVQGNIVIHPDKYYEVKAALEKASEGVKIAVVTIRGGYPVIEPSSPSRPLGGGFAWPQGV